jgi:hypothetical protein
MLDKAKHGQSRPAQEVFDAYFGTNSSSGGKPGPVAAFLVMAAKGRDACPGASTSSKGTGGVAVTRLRDCGKDATIHIQGYVLDRWHSGGSQDPSESKACAINTIAHEMSHLVINNVAGATASAYQEELYQDDGHRDHGFDKTIHLTSYTIGSLAQCTYMQEHGLIGQGQGVFDECLRTTMTTDFHASPACQSHDKKRW